MTEGCSNGLNGDAVKHLVTNCFPDAISHAAARKTLQLQQVADCTVDGPQPLCVLLHTKCRNPKGKDEDGDESKRQGELILPKNVCRVDIEHRC